MSHRASTYAKELVAGPKGERITIYEKAALMVLADYHNPDNNLAWPSVARLARESLMSERQLYRVLDSLEAKKILAITPRFGAAGVQVGNCYRFVALDDATSHRRARRGGRPPADGVTDSQETPDQQSEGGMTEGVTDQATQDDWEAPDPLTTGATQDDWAGNQNRHREQDENRQYEPGGEPRGRARTPPPSGATDGRVLPTRARPARRATAPPGPAALHWVSADELALLASLGRTG